MPMRQATSSPDTLARMREPSPSGEDSTRRTLASTCPPKPRMVSTPRALAAAARRSKWGLSRLSTATPPGSMPANTSALASAICSTVSKKALCTASTVVITATWGRTSRDMGSISPGLFIPISKTPKAVSDGMRARLSGRPHLLLRLPLLALVGPWRPSTVFSASLTPVLPTLPVTAMMRPSVRARAAAARSPSAARVSSTTSSGMSAVPFGGVRSTTAAAAPRASARKSCPSNRGPLMATNRSPGLRVRVSMETPVASQVAPPRPPVASAAFADVHRMSRSLSPPVIVRAPRWRR